MQMRHQKGNPSIPTLSVSIDNFPLGDVTFCAIIANGHNRQIISDDSFLILFSCADHTLREIMVSEWFIDRFTLYGNLTLESDVR